MRKPLFLICLLSLLLFALSGCGNQYDRVYYHNRNGHYRSAHMRRNRPWFYSGEKGYNKNARQVMRRWDRYYH